MMATLLLRLAAPLQAWGVDSKFEIRRTGREPTKSGVIGLLAAALGLRRDDDQAMQRLNALRFAVRVDQEGSLLADYHTAKNPTPDEVRQARRKGKSPDPPYVTRRYYLADAIFLVALESEDEALLHRLQWALAHPAYPLFLGRRSCPPTQPLCLGLRPAPLEAVLAQEPSLVPGWHKNGAQRLRIVSDAVPGQPGAAFQRDLPLSFSPVHRQFGFRAVREETIPPPAAPGQEQTDHDPFAELR